MTNHKNMFLYGYIFVSIVTIGVLLALLLNCKNKTLDCYEPKTAMYSYFRNNTGDKRDMCNCSSQGHPICSNRLDSQKSYANGFTEYQDFDENYKKNGFSNCGC